MTARRRRASLIHTNVGDIPRSSLAFAAPPRQGLLLDCDRGLARPSSFIGTCTTTAAPSTSTALTALSFPFSSSFSLSASTASPASTAWSSLWSKPTPPSSSTLPAVALAAFVVGAIFATFVLPRLAQAAVHLWQYNENNKSQPTTLMSIKDRFRVIWQVFQLKQKKAAGATSSNQNRSFNPLRRRRTNNTNHTNHTTKPIKYKRKALGRKGLVLPQYFLSKLIRRSLQTQLQRALQENLSKLKDNPNIGNVTLQSLELLSTPQLFRGWYYDIPPLPQQDFMRFEAQIAWRNALDVKLQVTTQRLGLVVPLHIYNVDVLGTVQIQLAPLLKEPPGFGAILTSFVTPPLIQNLQIDVADGAVVTTSKLPWLRDAVRVQLEAALAQNLVWPERIVQPSLRPNFNETILDQDEIQILQSIDPLQALQERRQEKTKTGKDDFDGKEEVEDEEDAKRKDSSDTDSRDGQEEDAKKKDTNIFGDLEAWAELVERVGEVFEND